MGERLAIEAGELYQAQLDGCPQYGRVKAGEMLALEEFSTLMSVAVAALPDALLLVARAVEDPDVFGTAVVEAAALIRFSAIR